MDAEDLIKAVLALKGKHLPGCRVHVYSLEDRRVCTCALGKAVALVERILERQLALEEERS